MKMRWTRITPVALSLLVALGLAWRAGVPPAHAAGVVDGLSTARVQIQGTVGGKPESVAFSGEARIEARLSRSLVKPSSTPTLVLYVDLSSVTGVGSATNTRYVISGPEIVQLPLAASDLVEVVFPFFESGTTGVSSPRSGVASFELSFDVVTGAITAATARVASPRF